jgi:hypothetical protein
MSHDGNGPLLCQWCEALHEAVRQGKRAWKQSDAPAAAAAALVRMVPSCWKMLCWPSDWLLIWRSKRCSDWLV